MSGKLDIKAPGSVLWKKVVGSVALLSLTVGGIAGATVLYKRHRDADPDRQRKVIIQAGVDPGFFNTIEDEAPPLAPPEILMIAEEATPKTVIVKPKPKPKPKPAGPPPPPTAKDIFAHGTATGSRSYQAPIDFFTSELNEQRRGSVQVRVASSGSEEYSTPSAREEQNQGGGSFDPSGFFESPEKAEQKRWNEPQDNASFPIPMDRVITVDRYIPAILINAIDSELGGKVVAQVEDNVFGAEGRKILIPAGSKAIGRYKPLKKVGEERLQISWVRIITPDGINIHTADAEMTDQMGRSGITGDVDRRYIERYGMSLLVSIITSAAAYSVPVENAGQAIVIEKFGNEQAALSRAILDEQIDIKPKVSVPAGSRILISPSRDVWFKFSEGALEIAALNQEEGL
jgi:type IV secretory pathway VirB10-like protein